MVDWKSEGALGAPFEMDIERGKIHEFARATGSENPAHFGRDPIAPPTFLTTMFCWEDLVTGSDPWPKVDMSRERGMHAEQEYIFHGPPPTAGTRLVAQSRIDRIYEKQGRSGTLTFVEMVTEFRDEGGVLVAEAKMTAVETPQ